MDMIGANKVLKVDKGVEGDGKKGGGEFHRHGSGKIAEGGFL